MHPEDLMKQTWQVSLEIANKAPKCGAKTRRSSSFCQSPAMSNGRCRMHGGKSSGAPCGENHGKYKHGFHTKEAKRDWLAFRNLIKQAKALEKEVKGLTS